MARGTGSRLLALLLFASVPVCEAFGFTGPADGDGVSQETAFTHVGVADGLPAGKYDFWVKTSADGAKQLPFVVHTLSNGGTRAWALVYQKRSRSDNLFTVDATGSIDVLSNYKLTDTEINYMTGDANPDAIGALIVPNYDGGHVTGNLLRADDGSRAYPIGSSVTSNVGDMAKSSLVALDYPTAWDVTLNDNSYCGGTQVWANWEGSEAYHFRLNSAAGCSYFNENVNGYSGPTEGILSMFVH